MPAKPVSSATSEADDGRTPSEVTDMEALLLGGETRCFTVGNDFERALLHDAVRLVMECHMHKCGDSCFKYTDSKSKYQLCRHLFYHVVTVTSLDTTTKSFRRRTKGSRPVKKDEPLDLLPISKLRSPYKDP